MEWAVYKAHDAEHMIAVCPSCHDEIHHGSLSLSDETLYRWKQIDRVNKRPDASIFVESALRNKLLAGTICLESNNAAQTVFKFSNGNALSFKVLDGDLLRLDLTVRSLSGREIVRVVDNVVRSSYDKIVSFEYRAGKASLLIDDSREFVPEWLVPKMRKHEPEYATGGKILAVDLEVIRPGLVRVQGCWPDNDKAVVITERAISFCSAGLERPVSIAGGGETTTLLFDGAVTRDMFGFQ